MLGSEHAPLITLLLGLVVFAPACGYQTHLAYHNYDVVGAFRALALVAQIDLVILAIYGISRLLPEDDNLFRYYITKFTWSEKAAIEREEENKAKREARAALLSASVRGGSNTPRSQ